MPEQLMRRRRKKVLLFSSETGKRIGSRKITSEDVKAIRNLTFSNQVLYTEHE